MPYPLPFTSVNGLEAVQENMGGGGELLLHICRLKPTAKDKALINVAKCFKALSNYLNN